MRAPDQQLTGSSVLAFTPPAVAALATVGVLLFEGRIVGASVAGLAVVAVIAAGLSAMAVYLARRSRAFAVEAFQREEELFRQEREFFRLVLDTDPNLIFVKDMLGTFVFVNKALADLYGMTPETLVGRTGGEELASLLELAESRRVEQEVLRTGRPVVYDEHHTRPDGTVLWYHTIKAPLTLPNGETQVLGIATDITERKQLEDQFRQAQKMEAIGRLVGGVAHDFNNLLTVINGFADMAQDAMPPMHPISESIDQIRHAGERATLLTRRLLGFSRKRVLQPVTLCVNDLLASMEKMLRRLIDEDVDLVFLTADNLWPVRADPGQLEQVVMNLCLNARDAMARGGRMTIATNNVSLNGAHSVAPATASAGDHVVLAVSDTGSGMVASVRERIFEPFFTTKAPEQGTGLGLATVAEIVQHANGHIEVESEPGLGSTFRVYLPRDRTTSPNFERGLEMRNKPTGEETVLLAEDDDGVRSYTRLVLRDHGYKVLEARHGGEALEICERYAGSIELLVTDVIMPTLSGRETAARLQATRPRLKVLYLSGYTDDAILRHGVSEVESHFLQKPFTPDELARKVRVVLDCE